MVKKRLPAKIRKKEIREAAKNVFLRKGFKDTTMEDVIEEVGMSKGGVYRHYKSISEMLYDLMLDGNAYRFTLSDSFMSEHSNLTVKELAVEITAMKLVDKNDYKTLYAMFLVESEKNDKLKELEQKILQESKKEFLKFIEEHNLPNLKCLVSDEFIAFSYSIIVATELLDVREIFLKNKGFLRGVISSYIEKTN